MTSTIAKRALCAVAVAVALATLPAIYVRAQTDGTSGGWIGRMISGCGGMTGRDRMGGGMMGGGKTNQGMMGNGMMGGGMMGGGMMGGGMMGGGSERPNQQWRK